MFYVYEIGTRLAPFENVHVLTERIVPLDAMH